MAIFLVLISFMTEHCSAAWRLLIWSLMSRTFWFNFLHTIQPFKVCCISILAARFQNWSVNLWQFHVYSAHIFFRKRLRWCQMQGGFFFLYLFIHFFFFFFFSILSAHPLHNKSWNGLRWYQDKSISVAAAILRSSQYADLQILEICLFQNWSVNLWQFHVYSAHIFFRKRLRWCQMQGGFFFRLFIYLFYFFFQFCQLILCTTNPEMDYGDIRISQFPLLLFDLSSYISFSELHG